MAPGRRPRARRGARVIGARAHDQTVTQRSNTQRALRALRSPSTMLAVLRAQIALRSCHRAPWSTRLRGRVFVENGHRIELGSRVRLDGRTVPIELVSVTGPLTIGDGSFLNYGCSISAHASVTIGRNCLIGNYVLIMDNDYHDPLDHARLSVSKPIVIEDDAGIGARAIILKGVRVGRGAVVAAGAVVTKDVPARTMVAGVPATPVRTL